MPLRILIFATTYIATSARLRLTSQWLALHTALNRTCDFLIVDSASPMPVRWSEVPERVTVFSFADNIGHLSAGGKDGWGRAFCHGLQTAIDANYDYVVHIEGDSLFRLDVTAIAQCMRATETRTLSVPVNYSEAQRLTWVETGLMFFDVAYLKKSNFIAGYDWPNRAAKPQPEIVIRRMLGSDLGIPSWRAERSDKGEVTLENVDQFDWITHCSAAVYDRFVESALG